MKKFRHRRRYFPVVLPLVALMAGGQVASAAELAGETTAVETTATAADAEKTRVLIAKSQIYVGELIKTDESGVAQLQFLDETRMVVGPNSQLTIDEFVFQSDRTAKSLAVNVARGAFRFLSGSSDKTAYRIETPLATIGVRGTAGDITVNEDGSASFSIYDGAFRICTRERPRRRCAILEGRCSLVILNQELEFDWLKNVYERTEFLRDNFPFAFDDYRLQSSYRVDSGSCEMREYHVPEQDPTESAAAPPPPSPRDDNKD